MEYDASGADFAHSFNGGKNGRDAMGNRHAHRERITEIGR
jgi:hypothetical protein